MNSYHWFVDCQTPNVQIVNLFDVFDVTQIFNNRVKVDFSGSAFFLNNPIKLITKENTNYFCSTFHKNKKYILKYGRSSSHNHHWEYKSTDRLKTKIQENNDKS